MAGYVKFYPVMHVVEAGQFPVERDQEQSPACGAVGPRNALLQGGVATVLVTIKTDSDRDKGASALARNSSAVLVCVCSDKVLHTILHDTANAKSCFKCRWSARTEFKMFVWTSVGTGGGV